MSLYDEIDKKVKEAEGAQRQVVLNLLKDLACEYCDDHVLAVKIMKLTKEVHEDYVSNLEKELEIWKSRFYNEKRDRLENLELLSRIKNLVRVSNSMTAYLIQQEFDRVG